MPESLSPGWAALTAVIIWSGLCHGAEIGFVSSCRGDVSIVRASKNLRADYGSPLHENDRLVLKEKASASVISYSGCSEYRLSGALKLVLGQAGVTPDKQGKVVLKQALPACYSPTGSPVASSAGGYITRGAPEVDHELIARQKSGADAPDADESALLYMILHHIGMREFDAAEAYHRRLAARAPGSPYVRQLGIRIREGITGRN